MDQIPKTEYHNSIHPDVKPIWLFDFKGFQIGYDEINKTVSFYVSKIYKGTIPIIESDIKILDGYVVMHRDRVLADV